MGTASTADVPDVGHHGSVAAATTIPLIAEHDSWITVDPILGCPADCTYCYLGALGLRTRRPLVRATPQLLAAALVDYLHGRRSLIVDPDTDETPVCLGNYTDMLIAAGNRRSVVEYLAAIVSALPSVRPLIVITKGAIDNTLVKAVDDLRWPIYWFFSQSMAALAEVNLEYGAVADLDLTLSNARLVRSSRHQRSIHFWRPFVPELTPARTRAAEIVDALATAGFACSVIIGLKRMPGAPVEDQRLWAALGASRTAMPRSREVFDLAGWHEIRRVASERGYPVYRNTSCGLALVSRRRERLGTWRPDLAAERCRPCSCPTVQRRRCYAPRSDDSNSDISTAVSSYLRIPPASVATDRQRGVIMIDAVIGEQDYNVLTHGLAKSWDVRPVSVTREKAWLGVFGERFAP